MRWALPERNSRIGPQSRLPLPAPGAISRATHKHPRTTKMRGLRHILIGLGVIAAAATSALPAQAEWPQRPVRFIIPLGAGSGVDITARLFADKLSQRWGQPVVVEN